jgi:hypothetical protein
MLNQAFCISVAILLCLLGIESVRADDTLNVKRGSDKTVYTIGASDEKNNALDAQSDKEKNVYSIGSSKQKKEEENVKQQRSWDMLMNIGIWQDSSNNNRPVQNQTSKGQPAQNQPGQGQPKQPVSGK